MAKYRKKPLVIDAWRWLGDPWSLPQSDGFVVEEATAALEIHTLEGVMRADLGDWIIRGVKGEFYPCKPDIFEATYDAVD